MAGLLAVTAAAMADDGTPSVEGKSCVGARYFEQTGAFDKVGEYLSDANEGEVQAHAWFMHDGATENTLFDVYGYFRDKDTKAFGIDVDPDSRLSANFDYLSFIHHLDDDLLQNMQAREANADGSAGGKQIYSHDMDPLGRYWLNYQKTEANLEYDLTSLENGKIYVCYDDQHKSGWKQALTIDHCAMCHVEGNRRLIDEQTRTLRAGAEGSVGNLSFDYEFKAQDFTDYTTANTRTWTRAQHPVRGGLWTDPNTGAVSNYNVEFGSRLQFEEAEGALPYAAGPTTEKRAHELGLNLDVNARNTLRGSYSHSRTENVANALSSDFDAIAAGWMARPTKQTRLTARVLTYEVKADDAVVDLDPYRDGRPGGSQDFDWTRVSAANRDVLQTDLALRHMLGQGSSFGLDWRHKVVDRPAMAQSQTTYYLDETSGENVMVPSTPYASETASDRFRATLSKRFGRRGNAKLSYTYTTVANQYMNPAAMCEDPLYGDTHNLAGNGFVYYFQRSRYGNGAALPNESHRIAARGSYQVSPRTSLNGYLNVASEKNDELNSYEYERTILSPGVNLWVAPNDKLMLTMGYSFNSVESNAKLCPPLFGG
ncbi:MAG: hypothetical protein KJ698_13755 [Actinobacteria bacterium]|nr:hypothetical protein [Actinomycetota bacterium]